MDKNTPTAISWTQLIARASISRVDMRPVKTLWWKQYCSKMVIVMTPSEGLKNSSSLAGLRTDSRASAIGLGATLEKCGAEFERTRVEGSALTLFFKDASQAWKTWNVLDQLNAERRREAPKLLWHCTVRELHCPVNEIHVSLLDGDFPTQVRSSLFQSQYRYRIVVHVPFGLTPEPARMDSLMDEWMTWQDNSDGEISKNAMYRWHARDRYRNGNNNKNTCYYPGMMSFYTNNQELSFVMKLSYPEFYHHTEKAVILDEVESDLFSETAEEIHDGESKERVHTQSF